MATRRGDVDFVVRARNEASKTLETINRALNTLTDEQDDLVASSTKAGSALEQFARVAATVATAYNNITSDADRAAAAFRRQEASLAENRAQYQSLTTQAEAAARVMQRLRDAAAKGPGNREQTQQLNLVTKAYNQLTQQADRLGATIGRQESELRESFYSLQELAGGADEAAAALARVEDAQRQAGAAAARAAEQQAAVAASMAQQQQNALRLAALQVRRDLSQAASGAQQSWQEAQRGIAQLRQEMVQVGPPTREQAQAFQELLTRAQAGKTVYDQLSIAIEQYNRVLRNQGASQDQVAAAQQRAQAALASARAALTQTTPAANQTARAIRDVGEASNRATRPTQQLEQSLASLFANSRRSLSFYQRLRGEILSLTASYAGLQGAIQQTAEVINTSTLMQGIESRLNVVTNGDTDKTGQELRFVREEAERLGFSLRVVANEWSQFAVSAQASNFGMENARKVFKSVSEAARVLRLDSTRVESAFNALTQMMSKGSIQMEELRQQLGEHIPGAFALMAEAVGVSTAELSKMMEQGELTSDYLNQFAEVLARRFGGELPNALEQTQAEVGRLQTAFQLAQQEIGDAGVLDAFTNAVRQLREYLRSDEASVWFQRVGGAISGVIRVLMGVLENLDLILVALAALGAARGVAYVISLTRALTAMLTTIRAATTATAGLSVAMAGLGGPVGIAIGLLAGAFTFLATRVSEADTAMARAARTVDDISQAYRDGARDAKTWTDALQGLSNLQIDRDLATLRERLEDDLDAIIQPFGRAFLARVSASDSPLRSVFEEIQQLAEGARAGRVPIADFKRRLDEIAKANPQFRELALRLQDSAEAAGKSQEAVARYEASIRLMRGEATEADKVLLGVAAATNEVTDAQNEGARAMERYTQAMEKLAGRVPDLKRSMEFQADLRGIQQELQQAFDAAGDNEELKQAALDRAAAATRAVTQAYDQALIQEFSRQGGNALQQAANLLRGFEGFRSQAYWDTNAFRVGYGSDTVTLDDGSIRRVTEGMRVSQEDALRDLVRRIGEFQEVIRGQIGSERFNAFTPEQQAALTSVAYNYGSLPQRILDAVRNGTSEEIARAVRGLAGDNGGINARRRNTEAAILEGPSPGIIASNNERILDQTNKVLSTVTDLNRQIQQANLTDRDKAIQEALQRAGIDSVVQAVQGMLGEGNINLMRRSRSELQNGPVAIEVEGQIKLVPSVDAQGNALTREQAAAQYQQTGQNFGTFDNEASAQQYADALRRHLERFYSDDAQRIAQIAGEAFDVEAAQKAGETITRLQAEVAGGVAAMSREEFIANEARRDGINLLTRQGQEYARLQGLIYDRENAEKRVNDLMALRKELQEQLEFNQNQGNIEAAVKLQEGLNGVNTQLQKAIEKAIEFWSAMGGPQAEIAIAKLKNLQNSIQTTSELTLDAKQINQQFAQGAANAFLKVGDALGGLIAGTLDGKEAMEAIRDAFLQFAADFLRNLAQMILQQAIFNAISGAFGNGGIGGAIVGALKHSGGIVGAPGKTRAVAPGWFSNAVRYHSGGIAGLKPNEIPTILERGEEVLTRNDPRHAMNGGASSQPVNLKVVNTFDAESVLSDALNGREGEQTLLNFVRANSSAMRQALGV